MIPLAPEGCKGGSGLLSVSTLKHGSLRADETGQALQGLLLYWVLPVYRMDESVECMDRRDS